MPYWRKTTTNSNKNSSILTMPRRCLTKVAGNKLIAWLWSSKTLNASFLSSKKPSLEKILRAILCSSDWKKRKERTLALLNPSKLQGTLRRSCTIPQEDCSRPEKIAEAWLGAKEFIDNLMIPTNCQHKKTTESKN